MTFPCKEQLIEFEHLEKLQKQIYLDALDYGISYNAIKARKIDLKEYHQYLREIMEVHPYRTESWGAPKGPHGKKVSIFIAIERDGSDISGLELSVSNHVGYPNKTDGGGYITIEIRRISLPESEIRQYYYKKA